MTRLLRLMIVNQSQHVMVRGNDRKGIKSMESVSLVFYLQSQCKTKSFSFLNPRLLQATKR